MKKLKRIIACLAIMFTFSVASHVTPAAAFGGCVGYNYHFVAPYWYGGGGYCSSLNPGQSYQIEVFCTLPNGTYYSHFGPRVFEALVMSNYLCTGGYHSGGYKLHEYA